MSKNLEQKGVVLQGNIAILKDAKATVRFTGAPARRTSVPSATLTLPATQEPADKDKEVAPEHRTARVDVLNYGAEKGITYATWGPNNRRPTDILKEANLSGILKAGLTTRRNAHYGAGPMYYQLQAQGQREVAVPLGWNAVPAAALEFHRRSKLEAVLKECIMNYEWWGFSPVEYVLSRDRRRIVSMRPLKAAWCRWSLMNVDGEVEWCLYNANWDLYKLGDHVQLLPVADTWWSPEQVRQWAAEKGTWKFVRNTRVPDPDAGYYPDKDWHSLYDNGWLHGTNAIPKTKMAVMLKAANLKYHIEFPSRYFELKYRDTWGSMSDAERDAKRGELLVLLNEWLSGSENAGKAFVSEFEVDEELKAVPGWKIHEFGGSKAFGDGLHVVDAEKGNSEILATLRVDPTLLGQGAPGGKLGAGSGSDKAEAIRILHALQYGDREDTTEAWYFVRDYNGWSADLYMGYRAMELRAMDSTPEDQPVTQPS